MDVDVVVVGAGVIGLAVARKCADEGLSVILLEKEDQYGRGVSSRNSEVIHGGTYYHSGSLKASLCLRGKILLYEYCKRYNVEHKRVGKLFIALDPDHIDRLEKIKEQAIINGVNDLVDLDQKGLKKLEPELHGSAAILSPSTGIIDSYGFMRSLLRLGESHGVIFVKRSPLVGAEPLKDGWKLRVGGDDPTFVNCKVAVNAAGLYAIELSKVIFPDRDIPKLYPTKGSYVKYHGRSPVKHIIYPSVMPGLIEERVDATPDLAGYLRFGPNVEKPDDLEDFSIDKDLVERMIPGIRQYLPKLDTSRLSPDFSGIRPKIYGPGESVKDFCFDWSPDGRWLDMWGIESPGLTSSLAIAEHVYGLIVQKNIL